MNKIKEAIKTDNGKLKYTVRLEQEDNSLELYIDSSNKLYFNDNRYSNFNSYPVFELNNEAHRIAKEMFLTYLQAEVKSRILELKQLELILDELGLKDVIRKTIVDNSSILLETKDEIIKESIENTNKIIDKRVKPIARKKD